ncbi:MAG: type I 3-dehydroquinate dehydratase [Planctomycetota bacterium]
MAEIVVSVFAENPDQTRRDLRRAAMAGADWVEVRLDRWPENESLQSAFGSARVPIIATCRTDRDGGSWKGPARKRIALLERAVEAGARGLDLEDWETWTPPADSLELIVRSHHDLRRMPENLPELRDRLLGQGGQVAKIVGTAHDLAETAPLLALLRSSDPSLSPTAAFALGPAASVTRVLSAALGARLVYASLEGAESTAPGQWPVRLVSGLYRVRELHSETRIFGLLGNPALHSAGPWVHNRALRAAGVDGIYVPLETQRPQDVLAMLPLRRLGGFSVTSPHKETAARLCHRLSARATALGAVNTITFEAHDQAVGENTDVDGVKGALRRAGFSSGEGRPGVVLGGGGAARAAAFALEELGLKPTILARSLEGIREFARERDYRLAGWRSQVLEELEPAAVVNTTPIGSGDFVRERPFPDWRPPQGCFVLDAVYTPRRTVFLEDAAAAGAVAVSGLEMFLTQAAEQVRIFTGSRPDESTLRRYLAGS